MDYEIDLDYLKTSQTKLDTIKTKVETINETYNNSKLNGLSNTEISTVTTKLKNSLQRLKKGYTNSNNWFQKYNNNVDTLENNLAEFKLEGLTTPTEFKGKFEDLYGKKTIGNYKTGAERVTPIETSETNTGDSGVLDFKQGKLSAAEKEQANIQRMDATGNGRATLLDIKVNGVSLGQDGEITIKKGEKVKLEVSFPDGIDVKTLKRTSADGQSNCRDYVTQSNWPSVNRYNSSTFVDTDHYTWYITGNQTGDVTLSQTALWSLNGSHRYGTYKGMCRLHVNIVD